MHCNLYPLPPTTFDHQTYIFSSLKVQIFAGTNFCEKLFLQELIFAIPSSDISQELIFASFVIIWFSESFNGYIYEVFRQTMTLRNLVSDCNSFSQIVNEFLLRWNRPSRFFRKIFANFQVSIHFVRTYFREFRKNLLPRKCVPSKISPTKKWIDIVAWEIYFNNVLPGERPFHRIFEFPQVVGRVEFLDEFLHRTA